MDQSRENIIEDSQDEIDIGELLRYLKTKDCDLWQCF